MQWVLACSTRGQAQHRAGIVALGLAAAILAGACGEQGTSLTADQQAWCRANSSVTVLAKAVELGYTAAEMVNLLDDVTVTGWDPVERDQRYVRACKAAYRESR